MKLEIHWHNVESSNLQRAAWHEEAGLLIGFKNDAIYLYPAVPKETFIQLLESNSKGRFFHAEIKDRFDFAKIDPERPLVDQVHQARFAMAAAQLPAERDEGLGSTAGVS